MSEQFPKMIFIYVDPDYKSVFVEYLNGYKITIDKNPINKPYSSIIMA